MRNKMPQCHEFIRSKYLRIALISVFLLGTSSISALAQIPTTTPQVKIQILGTNVPIRSGPGESYSILGNVSTPGKIILSGVSTDGNWFMFKYANGQGWIPSDPQLSKFVSGSKDNLPVVQYNNEQTSSTPTTTVALHRASLSPLISKDFCDVLNPGSILAAAMVPILTDSTGIDNQLSAIEKGRGDFLQTSHLVECKLEKDDSEMARFELAALPYAASGEMLIGFLYEKIQSQDQADAHTTQFHKLASQITPLVQELQPVILQQGYALNCTKKPEAAIINAIKDVYNTLDSDIDSELDAQDLNTAIETLEKTRSHWLTVSDPGNCSPKVMKLSLFTTSILDDTLIATLYLKIGNTAMFTSHAKAALQAAQYVNGLLS